MGLTDKLTAIADAIRAKTGATDAMTLDDMPSKIESIETGGSGATEPYIEETYDDNGNLIAAKLVGHTVIRQYLFYKCVTLVSISLPECITTVGNYAFSGCTGLTSVTFKGTLTTINSLAFDGCTNLTTINVPWSEGEVANAPWGATNATINYDYVEA